MRMTLEIAYGNTPTVWLTAKNYNLEYSDPMLTDLAGWFGVPSISIITTQKLIGAGSYTSAEYIGDRDVEITINITSDVHTKLDELESFTLNKSVVRLVRKTFIDDITVTPLKTETLYGKVNSVSEPIWKLEHASQTFSVLCNNPVKDVS